MGVRPRQSAVADRPVAEDFFGAERVKKNPVRNYQDGLLSSEPWTGLGPREE